MHSQLPLLLGQFLVDRAGITRWVNIEGGPADIGRFPAKETLLAVAATVKSERENGNGADTRPAPSFRLPRELAASRGSGLGRPYQRGDRRWPPPPPPPPKREPPPPPPDRVPGELATLTVSFRPSKGWSFSLLIASWASAAVDISTKPKPRDWPENRSVMTVADSTVPHWAKYSRRLSEVVE
jgi:hypothetical protein